MPSEALTNHHLFLLTRSAVQFDWIQHSEVQVLLVSWEEVVDDSLDRFDVDREPNVNFEGLLVQLDQAEVHDLRLEVDKVVHSPSVDRKVDLVARGELHLDYGMLVVHFGRCGCESQISDGDVGV